MPSHFHFTVTFNCPHLKLFILIFLYMNIYYGYLNTFASRRFKQKPVHNGAGCIMPRFLFQVLLSVKLNFSPPSTHEEPSTQQITFPLCGYSRYACYIKFETAEGSCAQINSGRKFMDNSFGRFLYKQHHRCEIFEKFPKLLS